MNSVDDLRRHLDGSPMSRAQVIAVAMTFVLSALDGYDVLSVTFAAPALTAEWGIGKGALGIVLSAGLAGMALGAFLLAPLADVVGRKKMVLASLALMASGMALSAGAHSLEALAAWRVVTGLGIGCCVAVINPIAAEFANARRRPLTVSIMAIGYPVGGVAGGLVAAWLLERHGWPSIFHAGALAALVLMPIVAWLLPESLSWLLSQRRADTLARVNVVLARFGHSPLARLPDPTHATARRGYRSLFSESLRGVSLWMAGVNALFVLTVYYVLSWLPQMIAEAGHSAASASRASAVLSLAGVFGGLAIGAVAQGQGLRGPTSVAVVGLGIAMIGFGLAPASLPWLMFASALCGFFLFGASAGLYATVATSFPDEARATGTGFVSGSGRVTSALAPTLAGLLFVIGFDRAQVSAAFGACSLAAGAVLFFGWRRFRAA